MTNKLKIKYLLIPSLLIFLFFSNYSFAQSDFLDMDKEMFKSFEEKIIYLNKTKLFNIKKEQFYIDEVLKTKKQAVDFAKFIMNSKYKNYDNNNEFLYFIDEDKTKKLWFIYLRSPYSFVGNGTYLIIIKSNCKIVSIDKTK